MPRRGEHDRGFPKVEEPAEPPRIGARVVTGMDARGEQLTVTFDTTQFRCAGLAAELGDEWVDYVAFAGISAGRAQDYRRAIARFCRFVDTALGEHAAATSLGAAQPDLCVQFAEWERTLPADYQAGSTKPADMAATVRALITRRAEHEHRPVDPRVLLLVRGRLGVAGGSRRELDEYSRKDKNALVRGAWTWAVDLERRLEQGWKRAAEGRHPGQHGWTDVSNLLWGLAEQVITPQDIRTNLPALRYWPQNLHDCVDTPGHPVDPHRARWALTRWLVRQLFPDDLDLHAYRVLLVAATGHSPDEIAALTEEDVEFFPSGVRLRLRKNRAGHQRPRTFRDEHAELTGKTTTDAEFLDRPRREVSAIIRHLTAATKSVRLRAGDRDRRLFVTATVTPGFELLVDRWRPTYTRAVFQNWISAAGIQVTGPADVRRLRKSTKVEKALAFGGRIADTANDHHENTFRGHYAQGTTLRVMSGKVIATSQDHWFRVALDGPIVLTASTDVLAQTDELGELGLSPEQADQIRQGALDMGLSQCRDPYDSPYSRPGELCAVAPLRCLECRNAWVLPSNLPQLMLFSDHLERLRIRLSPQHFGQLWGQSYVNLQEALAARTDDEKSLARKQIDASEASLHLPLSSQAEFDS